MINHSYTSQEYEWATMVWRAQRKQEAGSRKQEAEEAECGHPAGSQPGRASDRQTVSDADRQAFLGNETFD